MYFNVFTANLRHTHPRKPAHMPPITATLPLPSNEECRHCLSLSRESRQVWRWQKSTKGHGMGYLLGVWNKHFLVALMSPAATLVIDPIMPRCYRQFHVNAHDGPSMASNSTHPLTINDTPQRPWSAILISPSIHAHDHQLTMLWPWWPPWLWQAPHWQSSIASTLHQRAWSTSPMSMSHQAHHTWSS